MAAKLPDKKKRKGFATIYVTLVAMFLLVPMAGLAIDFGVMYNVKARLQTACDAAAIGAGYLLHATTNINDPTQLATITSTAQDFFYANYPSNYMGTTVTSYTDSVTSGTSGKTITINATVSLPMLIMRVLGISNSTIAAKSVSNVKYISMMIVVDRSESVVIESGAESAITTALTDFVADSATSYLVDGTDTVGMVSFGMSWDLNLAPTKTFRSGASPNNITSAISAIPWSADGGTNTAEGLYQGWYQLYQGYQTGALNVIVLLTDGRPTAFTGYLTPSGTTTCTNKSQRSGVFFNSPDLGTYPFWPPGNSQSNPNSSWGFFASIYSSSYTTEEANLAANSSGCYYASNDYNAYKDFASTFQTSVGPVDNVNTGTHYPSGITAGSGFSTQCGYYNMVGGCAGTSTYLSDGAQMTTNTVTSATSMVDPRAVRYASFNVADNMATAIRNDTTLSPMIFVVGLTYSGTTTEPLDADWLARVANDPNYVTTGSDTSVVAAGQSVYQSGQTPGMYCSSTISTLSTCFEQVTSHLLRLIQ